MIAYILACLLSAGKERGSSSFTTPYGNLHPGLTLPHHNPNTAAGDKGKTQLPAGDKQLCIDMVTAEQSKPLHPKLQTCNVALEMKPLWDEFYTLGTEMIVTKAGR